MGLLIEVNTCIMKTIMQWIESMFTEYTDCINSIMRTQAMDSFTPLNCVSKTLLGELLTFGLCEVTLLNTSTESLIELIVKDSGCGGGGLVVGKNVLLQGLTAVQRRCKYGYNRKRCTHMETTV